MTYSGPPYSGLGAGDYQPEPTLLQRRHQAWSEHCRRTTDYKRIEQLHRDIERRCVTDDPLATRHAATRHAQQMIREGATIAEAARAIGVNPSTLKDRLRRLRLKGGG